MNIIKVGGAALNQTPLDWDGNKERILTAISAARKDQVSVLCLPELCISGYGCEDAFHGKGVHEMSLRVLDEILPHCQDIIVSLGLPLFYQHTLFNCACLIADKRICGFVAKRFLAGDGIHYEQRWFKPWPEGQVAQVKIKEQNFPLGDIYFDFSGVKIGFEICEEAWVAKRPGSELSQRGIDIILNPSASHFAFGKFEVRKRFVLEGSRAFGVTYIYANLLGNESGRAIYDGGTLIAEAGEMLAVGPRFSYQDMLLTSCVVDLDKARTVQARLGSFKPNLQAQGNSCISSTFSFQKHTPAAKLSSVDSWEGKTDLKNEEFARAVCLGLFDYLRKSKSNGFVISLSGGADSSCVACLVWSMLRLAVNELGKAEFFNKLPKAAGLITCTDEELTQHLLTCIYQSTENSSTTTLKAAQELSQALGARFFQWNVSDISKQYVNLAAKSLGRELSWEQDDLALQNVQARVRSPGVWLIANILNALLLVTSNRSEAAVGYTTMDGDSSGSLCPIAGVDKAFIREWLIWLEKTGISGLKPISALKFVNTQEPTAELRPANRKQTDEADLMPYAVLDRIERLAIFNRLTPLEIFQSLKVEFTKYSNADLLLWTERFFTLWSKNQWKRERYAPSFHLDDESLDPKTWCRFPILSAGYIRELKELKEYVCQNK